MKISLKRLPNSRVELTIEVLAEQMAPFFEQAVIQLGKSVTIPGFRMGKAPAALIRERIGQDQVTAKAVDLALPATYRDALMEKQLIPVSEPAVHIEHVGEEEDFIFRVEVDIVPDVTVPNYRRIRVNKKKYQPKPVTKQEVEEALLRLRKAFATTTPVTRGAQKGDWIEIGYSGKVHGVVQAGLEEQRHPLVLGEQTLIPGFEEQIVDMPAGTEKSFALSVPKRSGQSAAEPVDFHVTMHQVAEIHIPEMDDELAQRFGKKSSQEVHDLLEKNLTAERDQEAEAALETAVLSELAKQARLELPRSLIEREIDHRYRLFEEQLHKIGRSVDDFLREKKQDPTALRKEMEPAATQAVKLGLLLRAIAEHEELIGAGEPTSDEVLKKTVDLLVSSATQ